MNIEFVLKGLDDLFAKRESEKIEGYLSSHIEQALKEGDAGSAVTLINELIGYYRDTSMYDKAEIYCEKLIPFMERAGIVDGIAYGTSHLNIANAYRASGKLEWSMNHYEQVFAIYDGILDKKDMRYASLYNNLALLYQEMKDYDKACKALHSALEIVKQHKKALIEKGVTYANLASSYLLAGNLEQAEEMSKCGIAVFQNGFETDYHYSAALATLGDIYFTKKEYQEAVYSYEKAMLLLREHVGLTHAYFRIVSNLQSCYERMGNKNALKGLTISRDYYVEYGKKAFFDEFTKTEDENFKACISSLTFGKTGEGSECLGIDDILSMDHDFEPGFCVFVSKFWYEQYGTQLEQIYDGLPNCFRGFLRSAKGAAKERNGIIVIEDYLQRILSLKENEITSLMTDIFLEDKKWLELKDWQLLTVTNGEIFEGENTIFGNIYTYLKSGYPISVKKKKMAQLLGLICQEGQYNYQRLMLRKDVDGAKYMVNAFCSHVVSLLFLINNVYEPHEKWSMRCAASLEKGKEVLLLIRKLLYMLPDLAWYKDREMIDWIGKNNEADEVLTVISKTAKKLVDLLKQEQLTEVEDIYLERHIPYILS